MIPRGRLDISFPTLFKGIGYCLSDIFGIKNSAADREPKNSMYCLSVRTGLHLVLSALNLPPGSEILVTNINIPDMFTILSAHQLKLVPLSVNKHTLNISVEEVEAAITPSTRAILITHLFGAIMETKEIVELAKRNDLLVLEDCAQAFNGIYAGNPQTDVVMYSFGLIKTNTSITGARLVINDTLLLEKVRLLNQQLPKQKTQLYLKKLFKALAINLVTAKLLYTVLYKVTILAGKDFDSVLSGFTRGFPGADVMSKIRFRPCDANIKLMQKRAVQFSSDAMLKRRHMALKILEPVSDSLKIGSKNQDHSYWVIVVETRRTAELIADLRASGLDATAKASSLVRFDSSAFANEELNLDHLVYLPKPESVYQLRLTSYK